MKESKEFDNEIDKRFNEELNEIKEKLNAEKLSNEFKANLNAKLQEELNKDDSSKGKIFNFPTISRKLAGICACFVFLFSSCFVFADDIENVILDLFGNTDRIIANAIKDGNYKDIEMEYVEDQGVSIKVDYIVAQDDELYIAFNVLGEECDKVFFSDIKIKDQEDNLVYTRNGQKNNSMFEYVYKKISNKNIIAICKLSKIENNLENIERINVEINGIDYIKDDIYLNKQVDLKLNVEI